MQEHAERPHVVQRLIAEAQVLVQQAQQLEVRLDKDVVQLQVSHGGLALQTCVLLLYCTWHPNAHADYKSRVTDEPLISSELRCHQQWASHP